MLTSDRKCQLEDFLNTLGFENLASPDLELLDTALTHSSYSYENKSEKNFERLEFLGDAILKICASRYLYDRFPEYQEGELSKICSILVSDVYLETFALRLNLGEYIKLGENERKSGGKFKSSILACAFEALLAFIYLEFGNDAVKNFLEKIYREDIENINNNSAEYNAKALLQEYTQGKTNEIPFYETIQEKGPPHNRIFKVQVAYKRKVLGAGEGKTKKEAQQNAARQACEALGILMRQ